MLSTTVTIGKLNGNIEIGKIFEPLIFHTMDYHGNEIKMPTDRADSMADSEVQG